MSSAGQWKTSTREAQLLESREAQQFSTGDIRFVQAKTRSLELDNQE
jgi:hypothetical protein